MSRPSILNPDSAPATLEPVALSQWLLAEARAMNEPGQCSELDPLAAQLHDVVPEALPGDAARITFWTNLYNSLVLHCLCLRPLHGSLLRHLRIFDRVAYRVGDHPYSLNIIENGVLRCNRRAPLRPRRQVRSSDPRLAARPARLDPRIHFALNCGARSCPPIKTYEAESLDSQLDMAAASYLEQEAELDPERRRVTLPRLMRFYRTDFGDRRQRLELAARYMPDLRSWLAEDGPRIRVRHGKFDWTVASPAR